MWSFFTKFLTNKDNHHHHQHPVEGKTYVKYLEDSNLLRLRPTSVAVSLDNKDEITESSTVHHHYHHYYGNKKNQKKDCENVTVEMASNLNDYCTYDIENEVEEEDPDFDTRGNRQFYDLCCLFFEEVRLKTFDNWAYDHEVSRHELAADGFYYTRIEDNVCCAFCNIVIGEWKKNDAVNFEHRRRHNVIECTLALHGNAYIGNIPLKKEDGDIYDILLKYYYKMLNYRKFVTYNNNDIDFKVIQDFQRNSFEDDCGVFSESFKDKLIESGFYYTGVSDFVKCYKCEGGLYNWRMSTDDPKQEHDKFYPYCSSISDLNTMVFRKPKLSMTERMKISELEIFKVANQIYQNRVALESEFVNQIQQHGFPFKDMHHILMKLYKPQSHE